MHQSWALAWGESYPNSSNPWIVSASSSRSCDATDRSPYPRCGARGARRTLVPRRGTPRPTLLYGVVERLHFILEVIYVHRSTTSSHNLGSSRPRHYPMSLMRLESPSNSTTPASSKSTSTRRDRVSQERLDSFLIATIALVETTGSSVSVPQVSPLEPLHAILHGLDSVS